MTKNPNIHDYYNKNSNLIQLIFPLDVGKLISPDDSVVLLSNILEGLDYTKLFNAYSCKGRNSKVSPINLFKILVYSYMNNIYSSRKIELACKRDINFMWLLDGASAPDHNTIARFRTGRLQHVIKDLFSQLVSKLSLINEISNENVFIDGTKIESVANKYTFVWKKNIDKLEEKLNSSAINFVENINSNLSTSFNLDKYDSLYSMLCDVDNYLINKCKELNIQFVYGKGKRKHPIQRYAEGIKGFIERLKKYHYYNSNFNGRNSLSKTDIDATFMHMKEDHMRNSQLKPGYNVQLAVANEYIVGSNVSSERSDQLTFIPFMKDLESTLPAKFKNIVADAGYESHENYSYLESNNYEAYIKPTNYKSKKKSIGAVENMHYDNENDIYVCANNRLLKPIKVTTRKSKSGFSSQITIYECESCTSCALKANCTKAKGNKQITINKDFNVKRKKSLSNITTPKGIMLRTNRSIQVEGAFGVIKQDYGFRRFLTKGFKNVSIEISLLCFAFNINKLHNKIQNNRLGCSIFKSTTS